MPRFSVAFCARSLVCLGVSFQLGLGCNKDADSPDAAQGEAAEPEPTKPAEASARPVESSSVKIDAPPTTAAPSYAMDLDPLLDLVPAGTKDFAIIRDPGSLVETIGGVLALQAAGLGQIAASMPNVDPKEVENAVRVMKGVSKMFEGTTIELGKGMLVLSLDGDRSLIVYAASEPDALPKSIAALTGEEVKATCASFEAAPGYVGCTDAGSEAPALVPGTKGAGLRAELARELGSLDLERANIVARIATGGDRQVALSIETAGAEIVLNVALPGSTEVAEALGPGSPDLLALIPPGGSFIWANASERGQTTMAKNTPVMMAGVPGSLTGQALFAMLDEPRAMTLVTGLKDPAPLTGLLSLAQMQLENIPKTLPDGTTLAVEMKDLEEKGAKIKVLHATFGGTPAIEQMKAIGFAPEAHAFVGPRLAGVTMGADEAALRTVASHPLGEPRADTLSRLPSAVVHDFAENRVSMAMHLPLDGISTKAFTQVIEAVGATMPAEPSGLDPAQAGKAVMSTLGPLSSLTIWLRHDNDAAMARIALQLVGDPSTDEGRDALAAAAAFSEGKESETLFESLAQKYSASPRSATYRVRAGQEPDAAIGAAFMIGVAAAIAIPAFTKYIERSKAAAIAP